MNINENALLLRPEQTLFDVTDKSLYSFSERESGLKFREVSTIMALNQFFSLADSDAAKFVVYIAEKMPPLKSFFDSLRGKTEFVVKLSDEARKKLESEEWRWVFAKDGNGMIPSLYDNMGKHFAEQIRVGEKTIRPDMLNSLIGLTQKNNLDALTEKVIYLTDIVERIAAGQYNDRISMFYGARQIYIEAISINDPISRKIALLNAVKSANDAISMLQQTIKSDLNSLATLKSGKQLGERTRLIAKCFSKLNDSVQISVNVYAALGENRALLASVTSYQCFVEQTLLTVPDKISDKNYLGCTLAEIMHSCSEMDGTNWRQLPSEIVGACETIIRTEHETIEVLSKEFLPQRIGGQENETEDL